MGDLTMPLLPSSVLTKFDPGGLYSLAFKLCNLVLLAFLSSYHYQTRIISLW